MNNYKLQFLKILSAFIFGINTISVMGATDLTISELTARNSINTTSFSALPGGSVDLRFEVQNIGDAGSPSSAVEFFLSSDMTWDVSDVWLDSIPINQIPVADSLENTVTLNISDTITMFGQYYIIAYVDEGNLIAEDDEANNTKMADCYISVVDFTISGISATPSPVGVFENLSVDYTLNNAEGFGHGSLRCGFYISDDNILDASDTLVRTDYVTANNSPNSPLTGVGVPIPDCYATGNYYLIIDADYNEAIEETNETNNNASYAISITQATTDLYLAYPPYNYPESNLTYRPGSNISVSLRVYNRGYDASSHSDVSYYLSDDNIFDGGDVLLASNSGAGLNCGENRNFSESLTIPALATDGVKYIIMVADPSNTIAEEVETNNTKSFSIVVSANPDLRITGSSISLTNIEPGTMVTATCTIENFGTSPIGKSKVGVYYNETAGQTGGSTLVNPDYHQYGMLNPGETAAFSVTFEFNQSCLTNGTNYINIHGRINNMYNSDDNPANNTFEQAVTIFNSEPDLQVTQLTASPNVLEPEQKTIINFTVDNKDQGNANGMQTTEFYLSTDNVIDGGDLLLGSDDQDVGCYSKSYEEIIEIPAGTAAGDYFIIAKVDINNVIAESDETNNVKFTGIIVSAPMEMIETSSLSSGNWKDISWSNGKPDGANYKAIVNHEVGVYRNTNVYNLEIGTAGKLTIGSGHIMLAQDTLITKSDASGTASLIDLGQLAVYGPSFVQRYFDANKWHFISSPVTNATTEVFTDMYLMSFNETTNSYSEITSTTDTLTTMTGYAVYNFADTTVAFAGEFNTGNFSASNLSNDNQGFHLMGNPYPSSIDWDLVGRIKLDNALYVENDGVWATYIEGVGGANGGSKDIAPMQGFMIKVTTGQTDGLLSMNNYDRTHETATFFKSSSAIAENTLKLQINANGNKDECLIHFNDEASMGFDSRWDAEKLSNSNEVPQIYSTGSTNMAINSLPLNQLENNVELGVTIYSDDIHSIDINDIALDANVEVILEDKENGIFVNLKEGSYSFQSGEGNIDDRFVLHFGSPNTVNELSLNSDIVAYAVENVLFVNFNREVENAQIEVSNIMGKRISALNASNTSKESLSLDVQTGVYLVRVSTEINVITKKVFLK